MSFNAEMLWRCILRQGENSPLNSETRYYAGEYLVGAVNQFEDVNFWMWLPIVCQ